MQWSAWLKPKNLAFAAAAVALLGLTALALVLTNRVANTSDSIEHSHLVIANLESLRVQTEQTGKARFVELQAAERDSLDRLLVRLTEDLHDLKLAIEGAAAGSILLLLLAYLRYRSDSSARSAPNEGEHQGRVSGGAAEASPALLEDMGKLLQSSTDYADAYQIVQRCAAGLFADCSGALYLAAEPGGPLDIKASWGKATGSSSCFEPADCWAIRRGEAYLAAGSSAIACAHMHQPPEAPSLCVPVMGQGSVLGILLLEDRTGSGVLGSVRAAARSFANQVGIALVNMKLRETLLNLSVRDPLTGLFNRRYMEESLNREISAARRKSRPLGVAICDLNRFKRFNDTFGSDAGDYALREIAQLIEKHIRSSDIACRYGKDEIALIFPEAPVEAILMRVNQLREAIHALNLEHFGRQLEKISVSFGVSLFPRHGMTSAELLRQAELALSSAKVFGNNRVQVAAAGDAPS